MGELPSYGELWDKEPFDFYDRVRLTEPVYWDEGLQAWLVTSYRDCAVVLRREDSFERADRHLPGAMEARGNTRYLNTALGETHDVLHKLLMNLIDHRATERYRIAVIRPIVVNLLRAITRGHRQELSSAIADILPTRVGLTLLGVDTDDEDLVERVRILRLQMAHWDETMGSKPEVTRAAVEADRDLRDFFMPLIRTRCKSPGRDLISQLWEAGPRHLADWSEEDTYAGCLGYMAGGETSHLLCNFTISAALRPAHSASNSQL